MSHGGPDAVGIEPLAVALGATKGSGYWHWSSRRHLLEAVMRRWHEVATTEVIAAVEARGGTARERLRHLLALVLDAAEQRPGELLTLVHPEPSVRAVVDLATRERIAFVAGLLEQSGAPRRDAKQRAVLAYAAYVGYAQLAATVPSALPRSGAKRRAMSETLLTLVSPG